MGVASHTLVLTPLGVKRIDAIYSKNRGKFLTAYYFMADTGVLGKNGSPNGYETDILVPVTIEDGIGLVSGKAVVWHIGYRRGVRIALSTGHQIAATPNHRLLVKMDNKHKFIDAESVVKYPDVKIPVYLMSYLRAIGSENVALSKMVAVLLSSEYIVEENKIRIRPLSDKVKAVARDAFHYFIVDENDEEILVVEPEISKLARDGVVELISSLPLPTASATGYLTAMLLDSIEIDKTIEERLPILAVLLQMAGWIIEKKKGKVHTHRYRDKPVYYAEIESVEPVEDDFYVLTVPGYHTYIANGLVSSDQNIHY